MVRKTKSRNPRRVRKTRRQRGGQSTVTVPKIYNPFSVGGRRQMGGYQTVTVPKIYNPFSVGGGRQMGGDPSSGLTGAAGPTTTLSDAAASTTTSPAVPSMVSKGDIPNFSSIGGSHARLDYYKLNRSFGPYNVFAAFASSSKWVVIISRLPSLSSYMNYVINFYNTLTSQPPFPPVPKGTISSISNLPASPANFDTYNFSSGFIVYQVNYWIYTPNLNSGEIPGMSPAEADALVASVSGASATSTAPTTSVPAPPGPPVTPQTINSTIAEIKTLLNDIYNNPTISASARNAVGNAQNLINNPQLLTNLVSSVNNLKGSAPVAAALAQAFAVVSLQLIKEPALLQILQSLQAQYKNIMKPSVQAAIMDLFSKLIPLLEPNVVSALSTEVNSFMNASLSNPNIRNTVGQIVNNSSAIVSAAPVQAVIDTAVV